MHFKRLKSSCLHSSFMGCEETEGDCKHCQSFLLWSSEENSKRSTQAILRAIKKIPMTIWGNLQVDLSRAGTWVSKMHECWDMSLQDALAESCTGIVYYLDRHARLTPFLEESRMWARLKFAEEYLSKQNQFWKNVLFMVWWKKKKTFWPRQGTFGVLTEQPMIRNKNTVSIVKYGGSSIMVWRAVFLSPEQAHSHWSIGKWMDRCIGNFWTIACNRRWRRWDFKEIGRSSRTMTLNIQLSQLLNDFWGKLWLS